MNSIETTRTSKPRWWQLKYSFFSPLGKMFTHFDLRIFFQMGWWKTINQKQSSAESKVEPLQTLRGIFAFLIFDISILRPVVSPGAGRNDYFGRVRNFMIFKFMQFGCFALSSSLCCCCGCGCGCGCGCCCCCCCCCFQVLQILLISWGDGLLVRDGWHSEESWFLSTGFSGSWFTNLLPFQLRGVWTAELMY